uniref:Saposin B-type domain-containing protein n=1 Tax=Panagrellus redivivus TaxID=6233 RepID=A0A7E4UQN4_PANRE
MLARVGFVVGLGLLHVVGAFDAFDEEKFGKLKFNVDECEQAVRQGRENLINAAHSVAERHLQRREARLEALRSRHQKLNIADKDYKFRAANDADVQCSQPDPTLFPLPPTDPPATTTAPAPTGTPELEVRPLFTEPENDAFVQLMHRYHEFLDEDGFCHSKTPTTLADITDEQVKGFVGVLLTNHASYLCPICHEWSNHLNHFVLKKNRHGLADDEKVLFDTALAWLPDAQSTCSMLLPYCHEEYEVKAKNETEASKCIKCTLCNTVTVTLLQRLVLVPKQLDALRTYVNATIFRNICAEACLANSTLYGDEGACHTFLVKQFDFVFELLSRYLMPANFCTLTTQYCALNETPNILHCAKLLCEEGLPHPLNAICDIIPDKPDAADKFLNIKRQKTEL